MLDTRFARYRLRLAILLPLALCIALLVAAFTFGFSRQEQNFTRELADGAFASAQRYFTAAVAADTDKLTAVAGLIVRDEALGRALLARDRDALRLRSAPVFERLRRSHGITHLYFHAPDRVNVFRAHRPDRFGDRIDRHTALRAEAQRQAAAGMELGPLGNFTLRVVLPWYQGGRLIGYLELGEEIEHLLARVKAASAIDLYVTIDKRHLSRPDWEAGMALRGRRGDWDRLPGEVLAYGTATDRGVPIPDLRTGDAAHRHGLGRIAHAGRSLLSLSVPLPDTRGQEVGHLVLVRDITGRVLASQSELRYFAGLAFAVGGGLLVFFVVLTGRVERRLASSRAAVIDSEERFRNLVESSSDFIWEVDAEGRYVYASPKIEELLGYAPEDVLGRTPFDLMPPEEAARVMPEFNAAIAARRSFTALENRNLHRDGRVVVLETSGVPILNADGTLKGYRGVDRDITERKRAVTELQRSEASLSKAQRIARMGSWEWDVASGELRWSDEIYRIFGVAPKGFEPTYEAFLRTIHPDDRDFVIRKVDGALNRGEPYDLDHRIVLPDGTVRIVHEQGEVQCGADGKPTGMVGTVQEVTEQRRTQQRLHYLAYYDELTALPNRALFNDRLAQAITEAIRHERLVGVMLMDLDRFKIVNDTLGHDAGNQLLQAVAVRLKQCFRPGDTLARFGGDEFAVALADMSNVEDAVQVAHKVLEAFKAPFEVAGSDVFTSFSIGITLYPFDDGTVQNLIRNADSALNQAKAFGRNNFQFYSAEMTARAEQRMALETGLRHALERGEFELHYQPQLDMRTGRTVGMEALLRWRHPERGLVSPKEFIPVAEETGLIVPIGEWVLRTACAQAKAWQALGLPRLVVAVNLSARQFRPGRLVPQVMAVLEETGLDPQCLELEITESLLIDDADATVMATLATLKKLGITLAVDDFGTGYSSLSYLKRFPIDKLKIDQSFVHGVTSDPDDAALVKAIIAIARSLRLKVIAEGVETEGQLRFLRQHDCDLLQGYRFSRPLPADGFAALVGSDAGPAPTQD